MSFLNTIFNWFSEDTGLSEGDIEKAISILIDDTDPRMRLVSGYKQQLRKPVIRSLLSLNHLCDRVPGPFEANRKAHGADPQINALAASADELQDLFSLSEPVKNFFTGSQGSNVCYATLRMFSQEKKVFGMALQGDIVRRGVAQVAVNFSGHMIGVCAATEAEVRDHMKWRGVHTLAAAALERITNLKAKTAELETRRALLRSKLRDIRTQRRGLEVLVESAPLGENEWQTTQRSLEKIERKLQKSQAKIGTLDDYLRQVCKVFNRPEKYLKVKTYSVRVNRMGIKEDNGSAVVTAKVTAGKQPPVDVVLVTYPRAEMREEQYYRDRRRGMYS